MSSALVRLDTLEAAIGRFDGELPDEWGFEISYYHMLRLDFATALKRQAQMREFEHRANESGYNIAHHEDFARAMFVYQLKREHRAAPAAAVVPNPLRAGAIDV